MQKSISSRKKCGFLVLHLRKSNPNNTTPTFQEVDGVNQPPHFLSMVDELLMISLQPDYYSQGMFPFLFAT